MAWHPRMMVSLNQPASYVSAWGDIQGWLQHCPVLHYVTFYSLLHLDEVVDIYIHTKTHNLLFKIISLKLLLWRSQPCTRRHGRCRQGCAGWVNIFNNPLLIKEYSSFHILFFLCKILNSELPIIEQKLILVFSHRFYYSPIHPWHGAGGGGVQSGNTLLATEARVSIVRAALHFIISSCMKAVF